ncbi:MAG: aminotransferase [Methylobacteriaceae bacterium]|nr:aminotransferase [Methylobacteriaceae bacterium]
MAARINPLVSATASPAILETRAWLGAYDGSKGRPIDLSQAAPPYAPPPELLARLAAAAQSPSTALYGPVPGEYALRQAYAAHVSDLYGAEIPPARITITAGCNQAFVIATMLVAAAGDAIILPAPWYFNHKMTLDMLGVDARVLPCTAEDGFIPDPRRAASLIDGRARAIVLVTPNNPTGAIYPPATIEAFAQLCQDKGLWLIIDETYRDFLPEDAARPHAISRDAALSGNVIGLYSFSKSFALPGHRLGAMTFPAEFGAEILKIQDCLQICPARAGQAAVTWGLETLGEWRNSNRRRFGERAKQFRLALAQIQDWTIDSLGAFFAYVRHPCRGLPAEQVAKRLAVENGLLMIPGSYFGPGQDEHLRVSFGNLTAESLEQLPARFRL